MNRSRTTLVAGIGIGLLVLALIAGVVGIFSWASSRWSTPPSPPDPVCEATIQSQSAQLDPEQSQNAAIIAGVAAQRQLVPRAVSIALTTALQESGLRNLDYGDLDSLGLFQQRPSMGWGTPEQIMDPYYSTGKFFDVMVTVDDWQTADIGDVAQEVQRSGYPDAYEQHVDRARLLASALSGQTPAAWSCIVQGSPTPDPAQLTSAMTQAYGSAIKVLSTPATSAQPASLTIAATGDEVAWSAAAFAVSWASQTGVSAVTVGQFQWKASASVLSGWVGVSDTSVDSETVLVTF